MYYTKEEVRDFIDTSVEEIEAAGLQPLIPTSEAYGNLDKDEPVVGFMWIDFKQGEIKTFKDVKMEGKTFLRIGKGLYTDDRYALDLHQAEMQNITVEEIITGRNKEQEQAKKSLTEESEENVHKAFKNKSEE